MSFEIIRLSPETETTTWVTAAQRLWLTADGDRLVPEGDPDAASLFCIPGNRISLAEATRLGIAGDVAAMPEKVEASTGPEKVEADQGSEYDGLNVKQLRALADEREVDITGLKKRDEIVDALTAAAPSSTDDDADDDGGEKVEASTGPEGEDGSTPSDG